MRSRLPLRQHQICDCRLREEGAPTELAIVCMRSLPRVAFSILLLSTTVVIGCTKEPTPEEAARLRTKHGSSRFTVSTVECRKGEKQWDYVCQVKHRPTSAADRFSKPLEQRVGALLPRKSTKGSHCS